MTRGKSAWLSCASAFLLAAVSAAHAADHTVNIVGFAFVPNIVNAHPGDRVIFNGNFASHPTRSGPAVACTGDGLYFSFTTSNQGIFVIPGEGFPPQIPFNCALHCGSHTMRGVINITPISPSGGCCTGTSCAVMTRDECDAAEGSFLGTDSGCLGDESNPISCCPANFNQIGGIDVADLFAYINAWLAKEPAADFNRSKVVDVADLFAFINAWLEKC